MSQATGTEVQAVSVEVVDDSIALHARIESMEEGFLNLSVAQLIRLNARVRVLLPNDQSLEGNVSFQNPVAEGYLTGVILAHHPFADLRKEGRVRVENVPVTVTSLEGGVGDKIPAVLQDISKQGLGLRTDKWVPPHTWIKVELTYSLIFGEVQYCTASPEGGYRIGILTGTVIERPNQARQAEDTSEEGTFTRNLVALLSSLAHAR